jgi:hypothetical protein
MAGLVDRASLGDEAAAARVQLLTPLVKAWGTDVGCEVASLGLQVHGGMGFIEETGAAQHYRDIRIAPIYEGTNGIQAADLVARKLGLDGGAVLGALLGEIRGSGEARHVQDLLAAVEEVAAFMKDASADDRLAGSYPLLTMLSVLVAGWLMARQKAVADRMMADGEGDAMFLGMKVAAARYFRTAIVPEALGLKHSATGVGESLLYCIPDEAFAA